MKKKILSLLLALAVILSSFSGMLVYASATDDVEALVKSAFKTYIAKTGNASTGADVLTAVNEAIAPYTAVYDTTETDTKGYFIRHSADGVKDGATASADYPLNIPGYDGAFAARFLIKDENGNQVCTVGTAASIPHKTEDLGTLTTEIYSVDNSNFEVNANGNITAYTGNAEKIVIPYIEGTYPTFATSAASTVATNGTNNLDKVKVIMIYSNKKQLPTKALENTTSLKAVVLGVGVRDIREKTFSGSSVKYMLMSASMHYNSSACVETGNGYLDYGAFQNAKQLQNITLATYRGWSKGDRNISSYAAYNMPDYVTYNGSGNVYDNTALLDLYYKGTGTQNISSKTGGKISVTGERIGPSKWISSDMPLNQSAALAQVAADSISIDASSTADSVKNAIVSAYKNTAITATWTETPVIDTTAFTIDGVLTLSLDGKEIDIDVCNIVTEEPELSEEVIADIKSAFKSYVSQKGNASAKDTLATFVDTIIEDATVSIESDEHFFIYHAVDGAYDNATDYPISIPGHNGYVSAVFTVADANGVVLGTVGMVETISHVEENLGNLTTDVYSADSSKFTTDENGNITGYEGSAEKIVIPASFSGTINLKDAVGKDSVKAIVIGDRKANLYKIRIANESFKNWGSLRAVVLPYYMKNANAIGEYAFANNANLKYANTPHTIQDTNTTGYGKFCYGAFQNCVVLENAMCSCCGVQPSCTFDKNIYDNTAIRYIVAPTYSNSDSRKYLNITKHSYDSGTFVYLSNNAADGTNKKATLTRAATLAKEAANKYAYKNGDTADTVKAAIVAGYSKKTLTAEITADWNDTFSVSNGIASGVLTLTQGDYSVDVEYNYNPYIGLDSLSVDGYKISPEFNPETYNYTLTVLGSVDSVVINASPIVGATLNFANGKYDLVEGENVFEIKATLTSGTAITYTLTVTRLENPTEIIEGIDKAFKTYVDNKGNNAEPDALLSYINNAIAPAKVEYDTDGIFIRHAVDGVYDQNDDGYPLEIKGHDGSVAVNLKVYNKDNSLVSYYGNIATIPHVEENLGELTYDIFYAEDAEFGDSAFQMDTDGNLIGYTGDAEKIIIPEDFAGKILFTADNVPNKDDIKVVVIGGSAIAQMTLNIANSSFSGWQSLRAVELPRKIIGRIGQFAFAYNPVLKYVDTPNAIGNSSGNYGTFENEAFRDCPVLENINSNNSHGAMTTGQLWKNIYMGTAVRDYIYEGWYGFGDGGTTANIASSPSYKEGIQVILAAGGNGTTVTPTFTRAVTMAQEKADTLTVTADNAASALTTITGAYGTKITGITAKWADGYDKLILTYGNYRVPVICNKAAYNTAIDFTMNSDVDYRFNAPAGIRFSYTVKGLDVLLADEDVVDLKLGTLIAPADLIEGELTHFEMINNSKAYLDIPAVYLADENTVNAVLSNIKDANLNREFSAVGYAVITYLDETSKTVYADDVITVRPSAAIEGILNADNSLTDEEKATLEDKVDVAGSYTQNWIDTAYGSSDTQAMTLRNSIIDSQSGDIDTSVYTGETYYINEENFNTYKAMLSMIPSGSKVLFERDGTYRVGSIVVPDNNIYFGAYGEGAKPNIYGSEKNFANSTWTNESNNIWSVSNVTVLDDNDAGLVVFDNGKMAGTKREKLEDVTANGDFWYDADNDKVYLYSAVNPADAWESIEIGVNSYIFEITGKNGITIDNLNIRYTGAHAVSLQGGCSNIAITNCEIGYIGGSYMTHTNTPTVRFGNGVELWGEGSDITVDNCWIHQIYDTGLTHQGTATVNGGGLFTQKNITFSNNLIEYCALASIEYWTSASGSATEYNWFDNINYTDNICRFAGYGLGTQGVTRTGYHMYTSKEALNAITADGNLDTFYVSGNVFDTARGGLMQLSGCHYVSALPQLSGNTYMQNNGGVLGVLATEFNGGNTTKTITYYFDSQVKETIKNEFKDADASVVIYK